MKVRHRFKQRPLRVPQTLAARLNRRIRWDIDGDYFDADAIMGLGFDASERDGTD